MAVAAAAVLPRIGELRRPHPSNRTRLLGADPAAASIRAKNKKPKSREGKEESMALTDENAVDRMVAVKAVPRRRAAG